MIVRELVTLLGFETDDAALRTAERKVRAVADGLVAQGQRMALFLSLPIAAAGTAMVKAASDAVELQNKFNQVFRGMEDDANKWSDAFAKSVGRSRYQVKESLASFQSFFVGMGFGSDEAARMSKRMQTLAVDFGSFNNLSDEEASQRFIAAMSGSAEVLDRFGINLKASALDLELQALGLAKSTAKANEQQKAVARLSLITKAMGQQGATGDAVRTLGEFANRLRQVIAVVRDVAVSFGAQLLPWLNRLLGITLPILDRIMSLSDSTKRYILIVLALVAAIGPLMMFGGMILKLLLAFTPAILAAVIIGSILALVIEDIITWIEGGDSLIGKFIGSWVDFKTKLMPILLWLKEWFGVNLPILFNNFAEIIRGYILPMIVVVAKQIWDVLSPLITGIIGLIQIAFNVVVALWQKYGQSISEALLDFAKFASGVFFGLFTAFGKIIRGVLKILGGLLKFLGGVFTLNWKQIWEGLKDIFSGVLDVIIGAIGTLLERVKFVFGIITRILGLAKKSPMEILKNLPDIITTIGQGLTVAGEAVSSSGNNLQPEAMGMGLQSIVSGASKTVNLQPIVNVEVGSVRSEEEARVFAGDIVQEVNKVLQQQSRDIQASFPEVE